MEVESVTTTAQSTFDGSFAECKEQQLVFLLVRQLATAQFELANAAVTQRLWNEVNALEIDPERITQLLYGGQDVNDREALRPLDDAWRAHHPPRRQRRWFTRPATVAGPRSARPAGLRAHRPVG